jgi:hypothetical protein
LHSFRGNRRPPFKSRGDHDDIGTLVVRRNILNPRDEVHPLVYTQAICTTHKECAFRTISNKKEAGLSARSRYHLECIKKEIKPFFITEPAKTHEYHASLRKIRRGDQAFSGGGI